MNKIWVASSKRVVDVTNSVIDSNKDHLVNQAVNAPESLVEVSEEDQDLVIELVSDEIDIVRENTVESLSGDDLISSENILTAKIIMSVTLIEAIRRNYSKIKLLNLWVQIPDEDREEEVEKAVEFAKSELNGITNNEFGSHYSNFAKEQLQELGEEEAVWEHNTEDNPRLDHQSFDEQVFDLEEGAPVEGAFPGSAYNCACTYRLKGEL